MAISPYTFHNGLGLLAFYSGVPLVVGGYLLAKQFLKTRQPWVWWLSSLLAYLGVGTPAILFIEHFVGF